MSSEETTETTEGIVDAAAVRRERLVELLENDHLGYRLERFVASERENLAQVLMTEEFSFSPQAAPKSWQELFPRLQAYDKLLLPYIEFFAIGCTFSGDENAGIWADYIERTVTCNYTREGSYNDALRNLALYPALLLLYGAGVYAAIRQRWNVVGKILNHRFVLEYRDAQPFVLRTSSFDVLSEAGQKAIPNRERQYTPLLNHLYEVVEPVLRPYTLSDEKYTSAFAYFEGILTTAFAYAQQEEAVLKGRPIPEECWTPPARYCWQDGRQDTLLNQLVREATAEKEAWPPVAGGLYGGSTTTFLALVPKVKASASKRSWW